jgi:hypothetical protein
MYARPDALTCTEYGGGNYCGKYQSFLKLMKGILRKCCSFRSVWEKAYVLIFYIGTLERCELIILSSGSTIKKRKYLK